MNRQPEATLLSSPALSSWSASFYSPPLSELFLLCSPFLHIFRSLPRLLRVCQWEMCWDIDIPLTFPLLFTLGQMNAINLKREEEWYVCCICKKKGIRKLCFSSRRKQKWKTATFIGSKDAYIFSQWSLCWDSKYKTGLNDLESMFFLRYLLLVLSVWVVDSVSVKQPFL